uniref:Uncharacterized protein n=1 Tax=Rhizophora mucronata TaxID=61149 RepID=A0A2P2PKE0_RHIMU
MKIPQINQAFSSPESSRFSSNSSMLYCNKNTGHFTHLYNDKGSL